MERVDWQVMLCVMVWGYFPFVWAVEWGLRRLLRDEEKDEKEPKQKGRKVAVICGKKVEV